MQSRVIVFLFFALVVAVFSVINIQLVTIDFFFGTAEIQLVFIIIFSILIGALFMFILASMKQMKMKRKMKTLEKENTKLKEELEAFQHNISGESAEEQETTAKEKAEEKEIEQEKQEVVQEENNKENEEEDNKQEQ